MSEVVFGEVDSGRLILANPKYGDDGEIWSVQVIVDAPAFRVETKVATHYATHFDEFIAYVNDLAEHWRGWTGTKTYESLEKDFSVVATNDGGAHVFLHVKLSGPMTEPEWTLDATFSTEPGEQMLRAARDARSLLSSRRGTSA